MNIEEELTNTSSKRDKYTNLSYILWGFALATTSLAVTKPDLITILIAVAFLIIGFVTLKCSRRFILSSPA